MRHKAKHGNEKQVFEAYLDSFRKNFLVIL